MLAASVIKLHSTFFNSTFPGLISFGLAWLYEKSKSSRHSHVPCSKKNWVYLSGVISIFFYSLISISLGGFFCMINFIWCLSLILYLLAFHSCCVFQGYPGPNLRGCELEMCAFDGLDGRKTFISSTDIGLG